MIYTASMEINECRLVIVEELIVNNKRNKKKFLGLHTKNLKILQRTLGYNPELK